MNEFVRGGGSVLRLSTIFLLLRTSFDRGVLECSRQLSIKMRHQYTTDPDNIYVAAAAKYSGLFAARRLTCEQSKSFAADSDNAQGALPQISQFNNEIRNNEAERAEIQAKIERLRSYQERESCPSCLYVGVATSLGLAAYFAHLAMEKVDERTLSAVARRHQRYNKPIFLTFSFGWLAAGAYRWHLG